MIGEDLVKNPFSKIEFSTHAESKGMGIRVQAPTPKGLVRTELHGPDAVALTFLLSQRDWAELACKPVFSQQRKILRRIGVLVPRRHLKKSRYFELSNRALSNHPEVEIVTDPTPTEKQNVVGLIKPSCQIQWMRDTYTGIVFPTVHKSISSSKSLQRTKKERRSTSELRKDIALSLVAKIPGLFLQPLVSALSEFYQHRRRHGFLTHGDERIAHCFWEHNGAIAKLLHTQLSPFVSSVVGFPVKASYSYFREYLGGSHLEAHTDRKQCEVTLSVQIRHKANGRKPPSPWGFWFRPKGKTTFQEATLEPGDAILFFGRSIPHYRPRLPRGESYSSLMFHFVRESFRGPLS